MSRCLQITFMPKDPLNALYEFVQKNATKCHLEGTIQTIDPSSIRVMACGTQEEVEEFLDVLHKGAAQEKLDRIAIEPFLKDRDYRGVFRVIEP